jgi:hypothetical protein
LGRRGHAGVTGAEETPTEEDIRAVVMAAGVGLGVEQELLALLGDAERHTSSFARALRQGQAAHQHTYNDLVEQADVVRMIERSFVPSVMQTRDYATAVLTASMKLHRSAGDVADGL